MTHSTMDCLDATFLLPFSASAWNSAAPFPTLKHRSCTILFNKGHYFNPHDLFRFDATFSASAWNSAVPFTTLIHRSSTILFNRGHYFNPHDLFRFGASFSASAYSAVPFTILIHRSSTILFIGGHQNISTNMTCSALVPLFSASAWNSAAPFYTGLVPFYLSVGTRIFQPAQPVLLWAALMPLFWCRFFLASAWYSAAPFTTLIHMSGTISFISGHKNISTHMTCSALVPLFWCRFFRLQLGIVWHHSLHSYTGPVPFYLSVGTRIFQPAPPVLHWAALMVLFWCSFFRLQVTTLIPTQPIPL